MGHVDEIASGHRFGFGSNWLKFSKSIDNSVIEKAVDHLSAQLGESDLTGKNFIDVGSGSGVFSLAAYLLGATVYSFDYDSESVLATQQLKDKIKLDSDRSWVVEEGSVLDDEYINGLGEFDIVYSWGVLHHTGSMWNAINNAASLVRDNGKLFISIYNDQGMMSKYWLSVKKLYNYNIFLKIAVIIFHVPYLYGVRYLVRLFRRVSMERGMSLWYDMIDWLGGLPFEVAKPEQMFEFLHNQGFQMLKFTTVGNRTGCNEIILKKIK